MLVRDQGRGLRICTALTAETGRAAEIVALALEIDVGAHVDADDRGGLLDWSRDGCGEGEREEGG